ncbi:unnamed protein product, partial [Prorocentrum cordatum]
MQNAKAPAAWIQCVRVFQCEICMKLQRPRSVRVAVLPMAKRFNQGAHRELGLMERNRAVRREQLAKYHMQIPDDLLKAARRMTASQRNALRNVNVSSPAMLVLDAQPEIPGALSDEDFGLAEQSALTDPESEVHEIMVRRGCGIGEWARNWRPDKDRALEKRRWHGPAPVAAVEAKPYEDEVLRAGVVWATRRRAIYRCSLEQLRPELASETRGREAKPGGPRCPPSTMKKLRKALEQTRGAFNFQDLREKGDKPECDETAGDMGQPPTAAARAGTEQEAEQEDDDEDDEELLLLEESAETVSTVTHKRKAPAIVEARLSPEEKKQLQEAKWGALEVFNKNEGWEPIDESEVDPAACCPLLFLLKWKLEDGKHVADSRVLYQGFNNRDVAEGWKVFSADVKSAFLRADSAEPRGLKLYATPIKEMREMLSQQSGLEPGQLLKMDREASDDPFDICVIDGQNYAVDGLIGKHVDDFLGCGENASTVGDLHAPVDDPESFKAKLALLNQKFNSGNWGFGFELAFTGGELEQNVNTYATALTFEKYWHAAQPITIDKARRASPTSPLTPKEMTSFGTLDGQLQKPTAQGIIIAAATVPFRAAATGSATAQDMIDANKDLRFLNANAGVGLCFSFDEPWNAMRIGAYSDAGWASRPDGSSKGGYQIFIGPADELETGTPTPIVAMEWASKKLQRMCRSSLSTEAQAAALGVDSLMLVKIYAALSSRPDLTGDEAMTYFGQSPFITDAKCLYDASRSITAGLGIAEQRAAIEVRIANEQVEEIDAVWRWVNTQQQLADGLTKLSSRQTLADILRRGVHALKYDPNIVAGKKLSKRQVELREQELEQACDEPAGNAETTEQPKQRARRGHYGASGRRLAATLAAGAASGSQGRGMRTRVDLDGGAWDLLTFLVFVIVLSLGIGLAIGFCMGWSYKWRRRRRRREGHGQCLTEDGNEQWVDEDDYEVYHPWRCADAWTDGDVRNPKTPSYDGQAARRVHQHVRREIPLDEHMRWDAGREERDAVRDWQ